uniref:IPPc domain-containing protein n=1 Tax=Macrostomum lignano TaxID=282301 RepID=A0A1I8GZY7_9PLAT
MSVLSSSTSSDSHLVPSSEPSDEALLTLAEKRESSGGPGDEYEQAREELLRYRLHERHRDFIDYSGLKVFCGTWNVNNQFSEAEDLTKWLQCADSAPDIYALGFQELDMSTRNYLSTYCSERQTRWCELCRKAFANSKDYKVLKTVKLFSTLLMVAVKKDLISEVRNLKCGAQATGLMGFMANKGGTAVRFQLHDTLLTFVNCHLAAGEEKLERRYEDYKDILVKLKLFKTQPGDGYSTGQQQGESGEFEFLASDSEHHAMFWFGDLNFRLVRIERDEVERLVNHGKFDRLLDFHDELNLVRQLKKKPEPQWSRYADMFEGFQEEKINFKPSYKFEVGGNQYAVEKSRIPSWCDRVLFHSASVPCKVIKYDCFLSNQMSDHKPVACVLQVDIAKVNQERRQRVYREVIRLIDQLENAILPQCVLDPGHEISFGQVAFFETYETGVSLRNTGRVPVRWHFNGSDAFGGDTCPAFMRLTPTTSRIDVDSQQSIKLSLSLKDRHIAEAMRRWAEEQPNPVFRPEDILVVVLTGGKHFFLIPQADLVPTCFGLPLAVACRLARPVSRLEPDDLRAAIRLAYRRGSAAATGENPDKYDDDVESVSASFGQLPGFLTEPQPLPREVVRLIRHIRRHHLTTQDLLTDVTNTEEILRSAELLTSTDLMDELPLESIAGKSYLQTLFVYLECLPDSLLPEPGSPLAANLLCLVLDLA